MRVIFSGGGTGGHIYPALAIYRALSERCPEMEALYIGTSSSMEADIVPREGINFTTISSRGFKRKLSSDTLRTIAVAGKGFWQAGGIIRLFAPHLVIGTGGYVAGPVVMQAALQRIPTLIHEQNALPSLTNRLLARFVDQIALSFPEAAGHLPKGIPIAVTGNPVRGDILTAERADGQRELRLDPLKKTLLIIQGSLGSETVNNVVCGTLPQLLARMDWQVIFVTGKKHFAETHARLQSLSLADCPRLYLMAYLYNVAAALAAADLIVARAGGMMAEINSVGLPAIYIPSPYVADNHQEYNARAVEEQGAAVMIREKDLHPQSLYAKVTELFDHPELMANMQKKALALARPDAASKLAELAEGMVKKHYG